MFRSIVQTAQKIKDDPSVRVVIVKGAGSAFSSGLDVKSVTSNPLNMSTLLERTDGRIANLAQVRFPS
jgi:enoyl-CoA hydratase/carnithine racemase